MGAVENLGEKAQEMIIEAHVQGISVGGIIDTIFQEFGKILTPKEVRGFVDRKTKRISQEIVKNKDDFNFKLSEKYFNTLSGLNSLYSDMLSLFYELRHNPEKSKKIMICEKCGYKNKISIENYNNLIKISSQLLEEIRHVDRVTNKLKTHSLNVTYNYTDLSKKLSVIIPEMLSVLEKQGAIKIIRNNLRQHQSIQSKQFGEEDEEMEEEDEARITEKI